MGKTTCSVSISWFISFATNVEVKRGTTTIANWPTGFRRVVDGITTSPIPITLWGDGKLLATASVYAIAQGATPPPTTKPGDINGDGKVDITDYNILKGDFGKTGASGFTPSDINRDGKVDIFDYNIVITNAGK